jgi:serine protease AprX
VADEDTSRRRRGGRRARGKTGLDEGPAAVEQFPIPAALVEHILLGPADDRRVLQDSPILGDVWLAYAADPALPRDLLITPHMETTAAEIASRISERGADRLKGARIAYLQGIVAAKLSFEEVLRVLVPLTQWWKEREIEKKLEKEIKEPEKIRGRIHQVLSPERFRAARKLVAGESASVEYEDFTAFDRYVALAGLILWASKQQPPDKKLEAVALDAEEVFPKYQNKIDEIVGGMLALYENIEADSARLEAAQGSRAPQQDEERKDPLIFQVSLNRRASPALEKSVAAVKADAARTLFEVKCDKIVWAVLDSGIDAAHEAFLILGTDGKRGKPRVRRTFDFTNIREIVSSDNAEATEQDRESLLDEIKTHAGIDRKDAVDRLKAIANDAKNKRPVNWDTVEELITLRNAPTPTNLHGTHVAGIIGADDVGTNPGGMCKDIRLYDFRVLGKTLEETEFAIIAALQYIRYVNERHNNITIHGANLSLSIPHNVRNYACGSTPVCKECERLVNSGVVVVAAAGNRGYQNFQTKDGIFESYAAFSITDPGNADGVITVGATHGQWPHTYGVSFFSSRGPTGDGRLKPDIVAPGERVQSTVLHREWGSESGTSMAAPHVSGAAAMLMARYPELVGQPRRVKRILCETATDLGRERSFQGHGMLDVLRAFQSI